MPKKASALRGAALLLVLSLTALAALGCDGNSTGPTPDPEPDPGPAPGPGPGSDPGPAPVAVIEVTPPADTLWSVGDTVRLTATARDSLNNELEGRSFTWSSTDPEIVHVDSTGLAVAVARGIAEIRVSVDDVVGTAALTVLQAVAEVTLEPAEASLSTLGAEQHFTARALDENGNEIEGVRIVWQSSDQAVAVVDTAGRAVARGEGEATITAVVAGVPGHAALSVTREAASLAFRVAPQSSVAGEPLNPAIQVEILDQGGNVLEKATDAITLSIGENPAGDGELRGTVTVNAVHGVATFSGLWIERAASGYTLTATTGELEPATSVPFEIAHTSPARLLFTTSPPDTVVAGGSFGAKVTIVDRYGNLATGAAAELELAIGNGPVEAALTGTTRATAVNGVATFSAIVIERAESGYTLVARGAGLEAGESDAFQVRASTRNQLAVLTMPTSFEVFTPAFVQVAIQDRFGNIVTDADSVLVRIRPSGIGYAEGHHFLGKDSVYTKNGVATFDEVTLPLAAKGVRIVATSPSLSNTGYSSPGTFDTHLTFRQIAAGEQHTCARSLTEHVFCWGKGTYGQTSNDNSSGSAFPVPIISYELTFRTVATGNLHTCGVTTSGLVYCWGSNEYGQLGVPDITQSYEPVLVAAGTLTFSEVTLGAEHTCALATTGKTYCWGRNGHGQLGDGTTLGRETPVEVTGDWVFTAIDAGDNFTCAIGVDEKAYCWGENSHGQLGNNSTTASPFPVEVHGGHSFGSISAGGQHVCGVGNPQSIFGGVVYCWGDNSYGNLGDGTTTQALTPKFRFGLPRAVSLSAGGRHTCITNRDGGAICWGYNSYGQLGNGMSHDSPHPSAVIGAPRFSEIVAGKEHTCALTAEGKGYCWGNNYDHRLGSSSSYRSLIPLPVRQ